MRFIPQFVKSAKEKAESDGATLSILLSLSSAHFLNDALQMVILAIYPIIKENFHLTFIQIGLITLVFRLTASILQPLVGNYTDKNPKPFSLAIGMGFTLTGLLCLAFSPSYPIVLVSVMLIGIGSSIFHPESSRLARYASGGRAGTAQSIFQIGGNAGTALGPLLATIIVLLGQRSVGLFSVLALIAIFILWKVGKWYKAQNFHRKKPSNIGMDHIRHISKRKTYIALGILLTLIFSKFFYLAAMKNYLTFYMINHFNTTVLNSQVFLFIFLAAVAIGTIIGGPLGDKYGQKSVIWVSILGVAPFTIALPYLNLVWTVVFMIIIGIVISSAFPAIIIYGQDLMPEKLGMVSGLFFGLAFGMGGIGSTLLGLLAEKTSVYYMFQVVSFLPLLGLITGFLPKLGKSETKELPVTD